MFGYYFHSLALVIAIGAICFFMIGFKVYKDKQPLFFSGRYFFILLFIIFSPQLIASIFLMVNAKTQALLVTAVGALLIYLGIVLFFWCQLRGYLAAGITDESFRQAIHNTLNKLELPFEEQLSKIKLSTREAVLQIAIQPWMGAGQIKALDVKDQGLLSSIIQGVNGYYQEQGIAPRYTAPTSYIIFGLLMLSLSLILVTVKIL